MAVTASPTIIRSRRKPGARKEIWAYGLRNPHRLTWDVDPSNRANNHLIALVIGLRTWETVDIIHKGANYGYSLREGPQQLNGDNTPFEPAGERCDSSPNRRHQDRRHGASDLSGDRLRSLPRTPASIAIANGFVYRGKAIPALRGKFLFGDITSGRIWWAEMKEMLAADDGDPKTMAEMHEVKIAWNNKVYRDDGPYQRDRVSCARRKGGTSTGRGPGSRRTVGLPVGYGRRAVSSTS